MSPNLFRGARKEKEKLEGQKKGKSRSDKCIHHLDHAVTVFVYCIFSNVPTTTTSQE